MVEKDKPWLSVLLGEYRLAPAALRALAVLVAGLLAGLGLAEQDVQACARLLYGWSLSKPEVPVLPETSPGP
jgi:hypothetical protein